MANAFALALQSEWLKRRRSQAAWLVVLGALFTPCIVTVARLLHHEQLPKLYAADDFWTLLWRSSWESMAIFFLPMGAILATSLLTQLEYRNNAWKQVHALPQTPATIYFSKLAVIVAMTIEFIALFGVAIWCSALLPWAVFGGVAWPHAALPLASIVAESMLYFVDCLPIVALQYLLCLRFKGFLAPVGVGFMLWVGALAGLSWQSGYLIPYAYTMLHYVHGIGDMRYAAAPVNIHLLASVWAALFTALGYALFSDRSDKG